MTASTTRKFSELNDRLDATYHIAAERLEAKRQSLESLGQTTITEIAREILGNLDGPQREKALGELRTGTQKGSMGTFEADTLLRKYPTLCLALLEEFLPAAKEQAQEAVFKAQANNTALHTVEQKLERSLEDVTNKPRRAPSR